MSKPVIKLRLQNGLSFDAFKKEVFEVEQLTDIYEFAESDDPDFIIFGPYGMDIPTAGKYTRIGYFCENIIPDLTICDWAFGVPHENEVNNVRYKRIQWHNTSPLSLIKPVDYDPQKILSQKTGFCNFFYSHKVPYREQFFRQLSKYKKVDAPGKSMGNMPGIDQLYKGTIWERKRQFLKNYKFTIAFENYSYPGYQTEKLYDAMLADSVPIYCGDPYINEIFNNRSFINTTDLIQRPDKITSWLEKQSRQTFIDILPTYYQAPKHRINRKIKSIGRRIKMQRQYTQADFDTIIDRIIELDKDDKKYLDMLSEPWFINNTPPANASNKMRWQEIFDRSKNG